MLYYVSLPRIFYKTSDFHKTRHRSTTYESVPEFRILRLFTSAWNRVQAVDKEFIAFSEVLQQGGGR